VSLILIAVKKLNILKSTIILSKLSIDVWRDVFDFLGPTERKHLALISEIGDREFCDFCQKWLHEWTKNVQLGELLISPPPTTKWVRIGGRLERDDEVKLAILQRLATQTSLWIPRRKIPVPFAELEMPENIQGFKEIELRLAIIPYLSKLSILGLQFCNFSYLDSTALQFLRRMQSLFHDVYLSVSCREEELEATRIVIDHLLPLLTGGIERVCLEGMHTTQFLLNLRDRFHCPTQFLSIKRIDVFMQKEKHESVDQLIGLFLPWLSTGRADGQPRTLIMQLFKGNTLEFMDRIRQVFLSLKPSQIHI
jgi:hypothetical protein